MLLRTFVYKFCVNIVFISFVYVSKHEATGFYGNSVFLRNCQSIFIIGYTVLRSHQQHVRVVVSPHLNNTCSCLTF